MSEVSWKEIPPVFGDIVRTKVQFYHHYGIFVSEEEVIQFGLPDDPFRPADQVRVLSTDVLTFLQGGDLEVMVPNRSVRRQMRSPEQIVEIARQRLGEGGYDILHNNCEHFVNECAFGQHHSSFVQDVREKLRKKLGK